MAKTLKNPGRGAKIQGLAIIDGTASNDDMCSTGGRKATDNRSQHQSRNSSKYHWKNQSKFNGKSTQNRFRGGQGASLGPPWAAFGEPWTALETSWEALVGGPGVFLEGPSLEDLPRRPQGRGHTRNLIVISFRYLYTRIPLYPY